MIVLHERRKVVGVVRPDLAGPSPEHPEALLELGVDRGPRELALAHPPAAVWTLAPRPRWGGELLAEVWP